MRVTPSLYWRFLMSFILLSAKSFTQTPSSGQIKARVVAENGSAAAYVSIELAKLKKLTISDSKGNFILDNLPGLDDTLILTSSEFYQKKLPVHVSANQFMDLGLIYLAYNISALQDVEITGRLSQSYKSDYSFAANKIQTPTKDIPQSISTITKELIADQMALRLYDVLDNTAGVNHYSGYNEYTIRGFRAENPNLINGLRTFNTSLTSPMLINIERIEIVKGPVSVLYGNADPGGTINLVTKKPLSQKEYHFDIFSGSWKNFRAQADLTGPLNKSKTLLYRFNVGAEKSNSFRNQLFSKSFQLAPSFSYIPNNKLRINFDASISNTHSIADRGQPGLEDDKTLNATPSSLMINQPGDYLNETNISSILSLSYKLNEQITFNSAHLNYVTRQHLSEHGLDEYVSKDSISLTYLNRRINTLTNNLTNYFTFKFNTGKFQHQLLAGYDFIKTKVSYSQREGEIADIFGAGSGIVGGLNLLNPQYFARPVATYHEKQEDDDDDDDDDEIDADEYYTHGFYIQEQINFNKWQLLVSLRQEFYTGTGDDFFKQRALLPRVGITYTAFKNLRVYATYNKGFDPFEVSTSFQVFNATFKPIYSEMYEGGAKAGFLKEKLSATFAFYQITLKNVAVNANDPSNPDLFVQRGKERARGFETELNGNIIPNLSISASYANNHTTIIKSEKPEEVGMQKENAPRHISGSRIKYNFSKGLLKGFAISAGHSQASLRNTLDEALQLPGYCVFNSGIQYSNGGIHIMFNLNNISNKQYWTAAYNTVNKWPGAPRNFMLRLGYNF
jgi:iron complex outermembrane receptor protein